MQTFPCCHVTCPSAISRLPYADGNRLLCTKVLLQYGCRFQWSTRPAKAVSHWLREISDRKSGCLAPPRPAQSGPRKAPVRPQKSPGGWTVGLGPILTCAYAVTFSSSSSTVRVVRTVQARSCHKKRGAGSQGKARARRPRGGGRGAQGSERVWKCLCEWTRTHTHRERQRERMGERMTERENESSPSCPPGLRLGSTRFRRSDSSETTVPACWPRASPRVLVLAQWLHSRGLITRLTPSLTNHYRTPPPEGPCFVALWHHPPPPTPLSATPWVLQASRLFFS